MTDAEPARPLLELHGAEKHFGAVHALQGVEFLIRSGQILSIVGHNGAGKSTLSKILTGNLAIDRGTMRVDGQDVTRNFGVRIAQNLGIRCIFQEISLCPNLRVFENLHLMHPSVRGIGWRRAARRLIGDQLDAIFPGHTIDPDALVGRLSLSQRQMVETARAFTVTDTELRLIILDEPTSSLDINSAHQLLTYMRKAASEGLACVFISHRLDEVLSHTDYTLIMRDGMSVITDRTAKFSREQLIEHMGTETGFGRGSEARTTKQDSDRPVYVSTQGDFGEIEVRAGEIIGLAGLAWQGQREVLEHVFLAATNRVKGTTVEGAVAYVSGDRQTEGVFPLWSVGENIVVSLFAKLARFGVLNVRRQAEIAEQWRQQINIRTPSIAHNIGTLSGGNQQKVLIARAFATGANVVLFDDPFRGVDVGTKNELFARMRQEADNERSFVWYTTENEELIHCDRVYVFYDGQITDRIERSELTESRVLTASFAKTADGVTVDGD